YVGVFLCGQLHLVLYFAVPAALQRAPPGAALPRLGLSVDHGDCTVKFRGFPRRGALRRPREYPLGVLAAFAQLSSFSGAEVGVGAGATRRVTATDRASDLFCDRLRLHEKQQIVLAAGLRVCAGHVETTERVRPDHRPGAFAVQIQVSYVEEFFGLLQLL